MKHVTMKHFLVSVIVSVDAEDYDDARQMVNGLVFEGPSSIYVTGGYVDEVTQVYHDEALPTE